MSEQKDILNFVRKKRKEILDEEGREPEKIISFGYYQKADQIVRACVKKKNNNKEPLTNKIDKIVLNKYAGPIILLGIIYLLYELSIVQGYKITYYTWPMLALLRNTISSILPAEGLLFDPILRNMVLFIVDGIFAVLNYIPIFIILFTLIAILEDVGYIPRMTFIMDRLFRRFGLHGQSVFPLVLGGVFVGGCAIPGVMATRGIKDEKARLATILVVPLMNCLAKTPLYILLIGIFFHEQQGFSMFFISTISLILALIVSKIFSMTILKRKKSAPFILEMSPYHLPTFSGVLHRCFERVWLFLKKIVTIIVAVMIVVFILTNFPGIDQDQRFAYQQEMEQITQRFYQQIGDRSSYQEAFAGPNLLKFVRYESAYKIAKKGTSGKESLDAVNQRYENINPTYYKVVNRGRYRINGKMKTDREAAKIFRAYRDFSNGRKDIRKRIKDDTLVASALGKLGIALEPITKYAGFNWRVNIALISSFAAKESSVATLGGIYQSDEGESLEENVANEEADWSPLHALALMLFMVVYPPCIPTLLAIRMETGSNKWMIFAMFYPIILGLLIASLIFTGGNLLGLTGLQAMVGFYVLAIVIMILMAFIKEDENVDSYETVSDNLSI